MGSPLSAAVTELTINSVPDIIRKLVKSAFSETSPEIY